MVTQICDIRVYIDHRAHYSFLNEPHLRGGRAPPPRHRNIVNVKRLVHNENVQWAPIRVTGLYAE